MTFRYGSVCSGIEGATVAWAPLGWRAAFLSEIEPFPRAVLAHRHPGIPLHGDFTTIKAGEYEPINLLVGGTPCQSFSVAGLRGGLADERGNLALEYLRLADRLRPTWLLWENVPGVLSSNGGRDFGSFLGGLGQLGYGFAYRVLDARYFGLAQRRARVFVVGYLGDWRRAAAVLFEPASLRGHPPASRAARASVTVGALGGTGPGGGWRVGADEAAGGQLIARTLTNQHGRMDGDTDTLLVAGTLEATVGRSRGDGTPPGALIPLYADGCCGSNGLGVGQPGDPAFTLDTTGAQAIAFQPRVGRNGRGLSGDLAPALTGSSAGATSDMRPCVAFDTTQITSAGNYSNPKPGDPCHPLAAGADPPAVAFDWYASSSQSMPVDSVSPPLKATMQPAVGSAVRRLTPRECERLQGFPDDYTRIPIRTYTRKRLTVLRPADRWDGNTLMAADGPRYRALGNSFPVPVIAWIGRRIAAEINRGDVT